MAWGWRKKSEALKPEVVPEERPSGPHDPERYRTLPDEEPPAVGVTAWEGWTAFAVAVLLAIGAYQLVKKLKQPPEKILPGIVLTPQPAPPVAKVDDQKSEDEQGARAKLLFEEAEGYAPLGGDNPAGDHYAKLKGMFEAIDKTYGDEGCKSQLARAYAKRAHDRLIILYRLYGDEARRRYEELDTQAKLAAAKGGIPDYEEAARLYESYPDEYYQNDPDNSVGARDLWDKSRKQAMRMRDLARQKKEQLESIPKTASTHQVVDFELATTANLVPDLGRLVGDAHLQPPKAPRADDRHNSRQTYQALPRLGRCMLAFAPREDGYFTLEDSEEILAFQYRISDARVPLVVRVHASRGGQPLGVFEFRMRSEAANEWKTVQLNFSRLAPRQEKPAATPPATRTSEASPTPTATRAPASPSPGGGSPEDFFGGEIFGPPPTTAGGNEPPAGGEADNFFGGGRAAETAPRSADRLGRADVITEWSVSAEPAYAGLELYLDNIFFTANDLDNEFRRRVGIPIPRERQAPR